MRLHLESDDGAVVRAAVIGDIAPPQPKQPLLDADLGPGAFTKRILLNLEQAPFINSAGVGWLLACHKRARGEGGRLIVHSLSPAVHNVLRLMSVDRVLELARDLDDAERRAAGQTQ